MLRDRGLLEAQAHHNVSDGTLSQCEIVQDLPATRVGIGVRRRRKLWLREPCKDNTFPYGNMSRDIFIGHRLGLVWLSCQNALADVGYATVCGEAGELGRIVAGDDAVGGARQFDHALLSGDVAGLVRRRKCRAGAMREEIFVEVAIVRRENVGRIAGNANILRGKCVARSRVGANAGKNLQVVAVDEMDQAARVAADEFENVVWIDAAVLSSGLPSGARVVGELLLLNPDYGVRGRDRFRPCGPNGRG